MPSRPALVALLVLAGAPGCRSKSTTAPAGSASASARPKPSARASSLPPPKPVPVGCRVLTIEGAAEGSPKRGELLGGEAFFDLPEGGKLTLRHSETTRELALMGPGRFRACPRGEELVAVTRGRVSTTAGPGARAGAEVRLATPFGVVHFGDAALTLEVTTGQASVQVSQGVAAIDGRSEADGVGAPKTLPGPKGRATFRGRSDPTSLVAECEKTAAGLGSGPPPAASSPGESLGHWAVERLKQRQSARHACSRALAALGAKEGPEASRLWDQVLAKIVVTGSGGPPEPPEK